MRRYRVEISPEALEHGDEIQAWWIANRPKNRGLFVSELRTAIRQVQRSPFAGRIYEAAGVRPIRRILLPKTGFHVYYWPDEAAAVIRVYAIWHGRREHGPRLP